MHSLEKIPELLWIAGVEEFLVIMMDINGLLMTTAAGNHI
jgi:hypothetical protein